MKTAQISVGLLLLCACTATVAQEGVRKVEGAGQFDKYLTPGHLDRWIIQGEKDETLIAHVSSKQFDPILELAVPGEEEDRVLLAVDDKGSESRFSIRLPETREYSIRVHAFKYKGGGNYSLQIRRFHAKPLTIGKTVVGTIDREGKGYRWFQGKRDQIVRVGLTGTSSRSWELPDGKGGLGDWAGAGGIVEDGVHTIGLTGTSSRSWELLDGKGRRVDDWAGAAAIEEDGVHSLVIFGDPGSRYELVVREARQNELEAGKKLAGRLNQSEMDVWSFEGKPGDFRVVSVEQQGQLDARLIYAPREKKDVERIAGRSELPEIKFLPVASKGRYLRFAAVLGRPGRYQLQLAAESTASYSLEMRDPTAPIATGKDLSGTLPVGGSAFYGFRAAPGQLLSASLRSDEFDPTLSLYDDRGDLIATNDDGDGGLGSLITRMMVEEGSYRLHVASLGDGGGGQYELGLRERKLNELKIDGRGTGALELGSTDFWTFTAAENQTVLLSVRSSVCNPTVSLYSPEGVQLASDDDSGVGTDSLLAVKLPRTGRYTIWVSSERGAGEYTLRLIDGD